MLKLPNLVAMLCRFPHRLISLPVVAGFIGISCVWFLLSLLIFPPSNDLREDLYKDTGAYWFTANHLISDGMYMERFYTGTVPTSWRPPFYAFYVALQVRAGASLTTISIINRVLVLGAAFLIMATAYELQYSLLQILIAPTLFLFQPLTVQLASVLMSEVLFTFFITVTFWSLFRFRNRSGIYLIICAGVSYCLALHTRTTAIAFSPMIFYLLLFNKRKLHLGTTVLFLGVVISVAIPWLARNWAVNDRLVFINTAGNYNLFIGNVEEIDGYDLNVLSERTEFMSELRSRMSEADVADYLEKRAMDAIRQDPVSSAKRMISRFVSFWIGWRDLGALPTILLIALACVAAIRNLPHFMTMGLLVGLFPLAALHAITFVEWRFIFPALPLLTLAGSAVVVCGRKSRLSLWTK